jgi:hypothetical protein
MKRPHLLVFAPGLRRSRRVLVSFGARGAAGRSILLLFASLLRIICLRSALIFLLPLLFLLGLARPAIFETVEADKVILLLGRSREADTVVVHRAMASVAAHELAAIQADEAVVIRLVAAM